MTSAPAPSSSPTRRLGYRLFGRGFDYVLHLRPVEWPIMAAHTFVGYLLAVGIGGARRGEQLGPALLGLGIWVVLLNGGTLAINSAYDRDEGDIGYLKSPPPVPRHLAGFALLLMGLGQAGSFLLPPAFAAVYGFCFLMSLAYSVPPLRFKAVAGVDWVINMLGFGTLTPFAGFATTGRMPGPAQLLVLLAFCPLFAALYPLTQLYQLEEDRRRGDRTLALILGMRRSLNIALAAVVIAFALFGAAAIASEWQEGSSRLWRWTGLLVAALLWAGVLLPWIARQDRMTSAEHQRGMYHALAVWAVTDVMVVVAWAA